MVSRQNGRKFEGDVTEGGFDRLRRRKNLLGIPQKKSEFPRPPNDVTSLHNTFFQITFFYN
jgi:hypothetical protein